MHFPKGKRPCQKKYSMTRTGRSWEDKYHLFLFNSAWIPASSTPYSSTDSKLTSDWLQIFLPILTGQLKPQTNEEIHVLFIHSLFILLGPPEWAQCPGNSAEQQTTNSFQSLNSQSPEMQENTVLGSAEPAHFNTIYRSLNYCHS